MTDHCTSYSRQSEGSWRGTSNTTHFPCGTATLPQFRSRTGRVAVSRMEGARRRSIPWGQLSCCSSILSSQWLSDKGNLLRITERSQAKNICARIKTQPLTCLTRVVFETWRLATEDPHPILFKYRTHSYVRSRPSSFSDGDPSLSVSALGENGVRCSNEGNPADLADFSAPPPPPVDNDTLQSPAFNETELSTLALMTTNRWRC